MKELSFSVCNEPSNTFEILDHFNTKRPTYAQVRLHWLPWDHQKQELTAMAFYGKGADVSQVEGPVVSDLVAMNLLLPFTGSEIDSLGGVSAFSQVAWMNSRREFDGKVYAIRCIIDARTIFYWQDLLEKAGVDESCPGKGMRRWTQRNLPS